MYYSGVCFISDAPACNVPFLSDIFLIIDVCFGLAVVHIDTRFGNRRLFWASGGSH